MANNYTTSTDAFADISEGSYSSSDYPAMASFVTAASRLIDSEFGRWPGFFSPTTDTKTDYYDGSGEVVQPIGEYVSISAVAVSEQGGLSSTNYTAWTDGTDYLTLPYNASNHGKPITALVLALLNNTKGTWYPYQKSVRVTGIPGYSTTPPDVIALAARMQSVRWFMRAKQGYQDTGATQEVGGLTIKSKLELDPDIRQLLWPLKLELSCD